MVSVYLIKKLGLIMSNELSEMLISGLITGIIILIISQIMKKFKILKIYLLKIRYKFFPINANIVFSMEYKENFKTETYFKELKRQFETLTQKTGIFKLLKIKDVSGIYKISSQKEAAIFITKKKVNLLIWGRFSTDELKKDGEIINIPTFNFQYRYISDKDNSIEPLLTSDIKSRIQIKAFKEILDKSSFDDLQILSKSVFDTSIYIIAVTLKISGFIKESTDYFENLYKSIYDNKDAFKLSLLPHLKNNYEVLMILLFDKTNPDIEIGIKYTEKYLKLVPDDYLVMSNLAFCKYQLGKTSEAYIYIKKAYEINPNFQLCQINMAFKIYDKFFSLKSDLKFSPMEVIVFLEHEYSKDSDSSLLYGSGVINYNFGDKKIAKKDFQRFLEVADNVGMKEMVRKAKILIPKC